MNRKRKAQAAQVRAIARKLRWEADRIFRDEKRSIQTCRLIKKHRVFHTPYTLSTIRDSINVSGAKCVIVSKYLHMTDKQLARNFWKYTWINDFYTY